ncbi:MAG: ABC transporter substrate-binding protein [Deltaproteobacteria bacterium]|nr:ABC transporter substrate-binding protein [Deltaproteobacteria bacterium]
MAFGLALGIILGQAAGHAQQAPGTLTMAYFPLGIVDVPVMVMQKLGLPQKYGVNVEFRQFADYQSANDAWSYRRVTAMTVNVLQSSVHRIQRGYGLAVFPAFYATNKLLVRKDSPVRGFGDLRGKRLGIPSRLGGEVLAIRALLKKQGIAFDNPKEIDIRTAPPMVLPSLVAKGEVDAIVLFEPLAFRAELGGLKPVQNLSEEWRRETGQPLLFIALSVDDQFARSHPDAVRRFVRMYAEAVEYIRAHPDEAFQRYREMMKLTRPEDYEQLKTIMVAHYTSRWDDEVIAGMIRYLELGVEAGLIPRAPRDLFTTEFAR